MKTGMEFPGVGGESWGREGGRERGGGGRESKQRERESSKTLFYKDCSLDSDKPVQQLVRDKLLMSIFLFFFLQGIRKTNRQPSRISSTLKGGGGGGTGGLRVGLWSLFNARAERR